MPKESYAECSTCMGEGKLYVYSEEEKPKKVIADKKLKEEEYKSKH